MAAYRKKAVDDRDALFGDMGGGGPSKGKGQKKKPSAADRDELFGGGGGSSKSKKSSEGGKKKSSPPKSSSSSSAAPAPAAAADDPMARLRAMKKKNKGATGPGMPPGPARDEKLKQAIEYRDKANQCLAKSWLGPKPDPVAASTYYKRAADAYQQLGDMPREERLYRLESGKCNQAIQAWASVAADYTRAADLLLQQLEAGIPDETIADAALEASSYHQAAAHAWTQLNEKSKAAGSQIKAAIALNTTGPKNKGKSSSKHLSKAALTAMEQAIEAHVPDVFNVYARYRQTGQSAFIDPDSDETVAHPSPETLALAKEHVVTAAYAHEPLQDLIYLLVGDSYREFPTALYAAGAASYLLETDGHSTLSCSRMFGTETILLLAAGDPVAAQEAFLQRHVQKTFYLNARECRLSEELFRAVLDRDPDALDEARSPAGPNKAALANLHSSLRNLVKELRVSGVARKAKPAAQKASTGSKPKKSSSPKAASGAAQEASLKELAGMKTGYEKDVQQGAQLDSNALSAELDDLDFGDDNDSDDDDLGRGGAADDDEFDLR